MSRGEQRYPSVPRDRLDAEGWTLVDRTVETVFRMAGTSVLGGTVVFDDERTRLAVAAAVETDRQWRFFFATRLTFRPALPPGGPGLLLSTIRSRAGEAFEDRLRDRGFEAVQRGRSERIRVDTGDRASLRRYRARVPPAAGDDPLDVTAWVGVWYGEGFRIAGGAYPADPLAEALGVTDPPPELTRDAEEYRAELLDLVRAVE